MFEQKTLTEHVRSALGRDLGLARRALAPTKPTSR